MEALYTSHTGSLRPSQQRVIPNNQLEEFFRASRRHQIGVFTLPCSVVHPERIIHGILNEQQTVIPIGDWLRFADDRSDGGSNNELQDLTHSLVASASAHSMVVNIERSDITANNRNNISVNFTMNGELLEVVSNLNYEAILSKDDTCKAKISASESPQP